MLFISQTGKKRKGISVMALDLLCSHSTRMAGGILLLLCYMDRVKISREVENPLFLLLLLSLLVLFPPFFQESTLAAAVVAQQLE